MANEILYQCSNCGKREQQALKEPTVPRPAVPGNKKNKRSNKHVQV